MSNVGKKAVNPLDSFPEGSPPIPWNTKYIKKGTGRYPSSVCGITTS